MIRSILLAGLLLLPSLADAATFYIDITLGDDARTSALAQSKTTPWKHARGMPTATGNGTNNGASQYTPVAGDRFIFKGGETWGNSNFKWTFSQSGANGNPIYIGMDLTWFTGGSWTRPKFDAQNTEMSGTPVQNAMLRIAGSDVTVDNIEFTGARSNTGYDSGGNAYISLGGGTRLIVQNNYFHGWTDVGSTDIWRCIISSTTYPGLTRTYQYNVFSGKDTAAYLADPTCTGACQATGQAAYYGANFIGNVCEYLSNCYAGSLKEAAYNLIYEIRDSTDTGQHENCLESVADQPGGALIHDNVIHTCRAGIATWVNPRIGETTYVWNNVLLDNTPIAILAGDSVLPLQPCCGTTVVVNNTIECGPDSGTPADACIRAGGPSGTEGALTAKNNHFITITLDEVVSDPVGVTIVEANNKKQTKAEANAQGYMLTQTPYKFAPTDGTDATVGFGTNLTSLCTVMTTLCSDTQYGVVYDPVAHTATLYGRTAKQRRDTGTWEAGAYNFSGPFVSPTWFHFAMEFIDSNIGTATTTYPYFTGYHLWPQAAGSTPPVLAPATITALSPGGASQTKDFILFYPAAGGTTMVNGLPSPAQNYFNGGLTRVNPLFSVINGNQTEMRNLTYSSGSPTRIWWDVMPEWDGLGGRWLPTTVGLFQSGTRAGNYTGFRTYVSTNWTPLWSILQTAQATRGYWTAAVTDFVTATHYAFEWGIDMGMMERAIDDVGDLVTGISFLRGAAAQYNKPWGIDIAPNRSSAQGSTTSYNQATGKQTGGWSAEYLKRHHYLSYMAGANQIQNEAVNFRYADTSLNPYGLMMQTFNGFAAAHPTRGTTVVPFALVMDHDHGFLPRRWLYSDAPLAARAVWYGKLPYNTGDQATDSLFTQLWPDHWRHGQSLGWDGGTVVKDGDGAAFLAWIQAGNDPRPYEPMTNSTYGDLFDVLLSDAQREALDRYNVVMPIGNFVMTAGWRTLMTDFATLGGIVVLNMSQVTAADEALLGVTLGSTTTSTSSKWGAESNLTESTYTYRIVTPTTATVIATNPANGNPLITMRTLGAGKVYFVAPNYMQNNTAPNPSLLNISKRLLQDLTETYRQGWAEGLPVDFLTTQGTGFKTVTVANNSASTWTGNVKFKQAAPTAAVEWLTDTSLSYSVASGVTTMAVTVPAFDVRIFALTGGITDTNPPASPTNVRVQ